MADLRIVDAPVLLQESITDDVKMPTGGLGNFSVRLGDILWYVITKEQLANKNYVDLSSKSVKDSLDEHIADKNNPHNVTKEQVGLGSVDNTADVDKPISNATKSAIITATTDMATKAYVNQKDNLKADKATTLSGYGITDAYTKDETYSRVEINSTLTLKSDVAYVDGKDGDLTTLTTNDKTNLVKAVNEIHDVTKGVVALYDRNVEAGAGDNGWDANLVAYGETTQKQINDGLDSIAQLANIQNPRSGMRAYVKSVAANYIYNSNLTATPNGVTIVDKWEMELQDYYYASWFCSGSTATTPKTNEFNIGYAYATSKGKPFIVDINVYVDGTPRTEGITRAVKILSNSQLLFTPKGKLTQIPVNEAAYSIINCFGADNFYIFSPVLEGDKLTALGTTGEWGYGLSVTSCTNGLIEYPQMVNCRGDGLYIGQEYFNHSAASLCPKDIKIIKPQIINAGRNGIALCCGENIYIDTPVVNGVSGKAPEAAIDLEPEEADDSPLESYLKNVVVHNATLLNAKVYGVLHWFVGAERNIDVKFTGRTVIAGGVYLVRMGSGDIEDDKPCVRVGEVYYEHLIHDQRLVADNVQSDANLEVSTASRGRGIRTVVNHLELHNTKNSYAPSIILGGISQYSGEFIVNRLSTYSYKGANNYPNFLRSLNTTTTLENVKIPIADDKEIKKFDDKGTYFCGDNVDIGGYQKITVNLINSDTILTNTTLFTPQADGAGNIYTKVMTAPNKGRKLTYKFNQATMSAGSSLQTVAAFIGFPYITSADKFAYITVDATKNTAEIASIFGKWTNGSTVVI